MAKFIGLIGDLSGKLGGQVYARNKAGSYVKKFTMPTNPKTIAQMAARAIFSQTVLSWHILGDSVKAAWNSFATNFFKPKYPTPGVAYSGFNAFTSLKNQISNIISVFRTATLTDMTYTGSAPTNSVSAPPAFGFSNPLSISGIGPSGGNISVNIISTYATFALADKELSFSCRLDNGFTVANPLIIADSLNTLKAGLFVMVSLPSTQQNQFTKQPKYSLIAATNLFNTITVSQPGNLLEFVLPFDGKTYKNAFTEGDVVELNLFAYNEVGQTCFLGSCKTAIGA